MWIAINIFQGFEQIGEGETQDRIGWLVAAFIEGGEALACDDRSKAAEVVTFPNIKTTSREPGTSAQGN